MELIFRHRNCLDHRQFDKRRNATEEVSHWDAHGSEVGSDLCKLTPVKVRTTLAAYSKAESYRRRTMDGLTWPACVERPKRTGATASKVAKGVVYERKRTRCL